MVKPQTYFSDDSDSDTSGILVVETGDEGVRVTENRFVGWCAPFWMPEQEFRAATHSDDVEQLGLLNDEKFERVVDVAKDKV